MWSAMRVLATHILATIDLEDLDYSTAAYQVTDARSGSQAVFSACAIIMLTMAIQQLW